ncbi:hypothetical protein BSKO_06580 [Bryopsis sp. KO-2023]|nr:hypothetical protein BSKO_06580 [Bryopsis sp. KO-2023]
MVARSRLFIDQGSGDYTSCSNLTSSSNLSGPSSSSEMIDDLEVGGELPPSPFSGRKSWGIDFKGFDNRSDFHGNRGSESNSTALDPIIRIVADGYEFLSSGKDDGWARRAARMCIMSTLLLIGLWVLLGAWSENGFAFWRGEPVVPNDWTAAPHVEWDLDKKPILGVITTHHRTGTVLFQSMMEKISEQFLIDYEKVEVPFSLRNPNTTEAADWSTYNSSQERLVVGMHGFKEDCISYNVDKLCGLFHYECWMDACNLQEPKKGSEVFPAIHVIRHPTNIVISAYLYHRQDPPPEDWLVDPKPDALVIMPKEIQKKYKNTPYYQVLRELPTKLGLMVEFFVNIGEIYKSARNVRALEEKPWAFGIQFEEIQEDFEGSMVEVMAHLGLSQRVNETDLIKIAKRFDLHHMNEKDKKRYNVAKHVTAGKEDREKLLKDFDKSDLGKLLGRIAKNMGYQNATH